MDSGYYTLNLQPAVARRSHIPSSRRHHPLTPTAAICLQNALGVSLGKVAETDFVLKDLAFAGQQYAVASQTNPNDFDTLYNYGLVLQVGGRLQRCWRHVPSCAADASASMSPEAAGDHGTGTHACLPMDSICLAAAGAQLISLHHAPAIDACPLPRPAPCTHPTHPAAHHLQEIASKLSDKPQQQLAFLRQACDKYEATLALRAASHQALYNWGVALSDVARCLKPSSPALAQACLNLASQKYAASLKHNPSNPQALNNWGLVLQDLSGDCKESSSRQALVQQALEKFRAAIRTRPDFDRGCYNMGTVYYTYAGGTLLGW